MCAAMLGQCGPRVPRFKSLFHSQRFNSNTDHDSLLRGDRHGELQSLWQEIGDDKSQKQEELRQMISAAVEKIYERAIEECIRRRMALEDMVIQSENRLKELLGSTAMQVIASSDLPLQIRLSMNTTRLQEIENAQQLGGYGWVGGLVVLVELRHRVASLREMLKLPPPCEGFTDLEEMLVSTTEALNNLCSSNISSTQPARPAKTEQKSIHQRLQRFYQTLCTIESACQNSFTSQDIEKDSDYYKYRQISTQLSLQELELKVVRNSKMALDRSSEERSSLSVVTPHHPFGFTRKRSTSKFGYKPKESSRQNKLYIEEASKLEKLGYQTLKKLEDITSHIKSVSKPLDSMSLSPFSTYSNMSDVGFSPSSEITENSSITKGFSTPLSMSPSSEDNSVGTPTSVLPEATSTPSYHIIKPSHWTGTNTVFEKKDASGLLLLSDHDDQSESIDVCWVELYEKDLAKSDVNGGSIRSQQHELENAEVVKPHTSTQVQKASIIDQNEKKERDDSDCSVSNEQWHVVSVTCKPKSLSVTQAKKPLPLPAPGSAPPPPPPPPPPPSSFGARRPLNSRSTKLKKSVTISRLYLGMKKKADGAANDNNQTLGDVTTRRSTVTGGSNRDGMAEALAEITRRSSYFRKIEDDVQKHAECIMEVKTGLESFETRDMQKLIQFHETIEARLEQLTDESQVLAKFEGFPIKKLETVRAAASLYLRMSSLAQQIEDWHVVSPLSEHLHKITTFFEKVKTDVEIIERTKEEDIVRFQSQKITFSFDMIVHIKEAMVGLSSRSLALALKDSQRLKASITIGDEYLSTKDMNKLRATFKMLWRVFQLAFRVHNFAGGHDDKAEQLCCSVSKEMETYPSSFWLELVNK